MPNIKPLILLAEDDVRLTEVLEKQINLSGMNVRTFHNGADVIKFLKRDYASIILLDINLPDIDGFNVMSQLHGLGISIPVIFLTGFSDEFYKLKGFDSGADDYVTKPFSFTELIARIRTILRRTSRASDFLITENATLNDRNFAFCDATVWPSLMQIRFPNGNVARIGKKEVGILKHFAANKDIILSRKNIIHSVWGEGANIRSRSMDQYIVKLRQLFKKNGYTMNNVKTLHGIGYMYTMTPGVVMTRREYADKYSIL